MAKTITKETDLEIVNQLKKSHDKLKNEIGKVIIGQSLVIDELLISLLSRGHCLLIGVPGLAKTLLISTVAQVLDLKFSKANKCRISSYIDPRDKT